jgi:hypothetical protein
MRISKWQRTAALLLFIMAASMAHAGDWKHMAQACEHAKDDLFGGKDANGNPIKATGMQKRAAVEDCGIKFYGLTPLGPQVGSIAPQGSIGLGLIASTRVDFLSSHFSEHDKRERVSEVSARGLYSPSNSYLLEGRYDFRMPALGQGNATTATFEDQIKISLFANRVNLAKQRFFGIGESSSLSGLAEYRLLLDRVGAATDWPIVAWLSVGGTSQWVRPSILGPSGTSIPPVFGYGDLGAPGALFQPSFMNYKAYLDVHTGTNTSQTWQRTKIRGTYEHFSDLDSGSYSFDRMNGFATTSFDIRKGIESMTLPAWKSALCEPIASGGPGGQCSLGQLTFNGLVTASYVGAAKSVPFYFQPTLGGTDINGFDTLRGYLDFRFRAPNRVLMQVQFDHHVCALLGVYGFYDLGKVALDPSDLDLNHLRHDIGIGASIKVQDKVVLRAYVGFGTGEGNHPNVKFPSTLWGSWQALPVTLFP